MEEQNAFKSNLIKYAIILGIVNVIFTLLLYISNETLLVSLWMLPIGLLLGVVLFVVAGLGFRSANGGYATFKNMFLYLFLVGIFSAVIATGFGLILHKVIDPDLGGRLQQEVVENTLSMMENFNAPEEAIDEAIAKIESEEMFSTANILKSFYINQTIISLILALIIGAILKRKEKTELTS